MTKVIVDRIWQILGTISDPEIPVVSLVELGIVRNVQIEHETVVITLTPTFAACPAMHYMREEIFEKLHTIGLEKIDVRTSLNPPWTSEWLSDEVRAKLNQFGIAPPPHYHGGDIAIQLMEAVTCPFCGSRDTVMDNLFGPTLCQSLHYCRSCQQSFQRFKPL